MSLINEMLKDLEKRRKKNDKNSEGTLLSNLQTPDDGNGESPKSKKKLLLLLIILVVILLLVLFFWPDLLKPGKQVNSSLAVVKPSKVIAKPTIAKPHAVVPAKLSPVSLDDMVLSQSGKTTILNLDVSGKVNYHIKTEESLTGSAKTYDLELLNTSVNASIPKIADDSALSKINLTSAEHVSNVLLTVKPGVKLAGLYTEENNGAERVVISFYNVNYQPPKTTEPEMSVERSLPKTQEERMEAAYQQVLNDLGKGNYSTATKQLEMIVQEFPRFTKARESLIKLLLRKGSLAQAQILLSRSLAENPDNTKLLMLQARIYFIQEQFKQAQAVLRQITPPTLNENPGFYAMNAALQQRLGHPLMAAELYEQLLSYDSNNSIWWMGLGIALESANKPNSAVDAFKRALSTGELNPDLRAFVATKIAGLGG